MRKTWKWFCKGSQRNCRKTGPYFLTPAFSGSSWHAALYPAWCAQTTFLEHVRTPALRNLTNSPVISDGSWHILKLKPYHMIVMVNAWYDASTLV